MWQPLSLNIQTRILYRGVLDSKVHGANMGPIWGRQDPGGPHVGPTNFTIWGVITFITKRRRNYTGHRTVDKTNHRFQGQVVIWLYHRFSSKSKRRVFEIPIIYEYNIPEMVPGSLQYNEKPSIILPNFSFSTAPMSWVDKIIYDLFYNKRWMKYHYLIKVSIQTTSDPPLKCIWS